MPRRRRERALARPPFRARHPTQAASNKRRDAAKTDVRHVAGTCEPASTAARPQGSALRHAPAKTDS